MLAVGEALQAKGSQAGSALRTASAGAKADQITHHIIEQTNKQGLCDTLRETFKAMDKENFFQPTADEVTLASLKNASLGADELRAKVNKARKQTAFRLFANAFKRYSIEEHGKQLEELKSNSYMFTITPFKPKEVKKGFDKWLADGARYLLGNDIQQIQVMRDMFIESTKKQEQEQEQQAQSIRAEVANMKENTLREKAIHMLELVGMTNASNEQIENAMERLNQEIVNA